MKKKSNDVLEVFVVIGVIVLAIIGLFSTTYFFLDLATRKPALGYAEIKEETDACDKEGRLSEGYQDRDGNITKIVCGLPPFQDKRGWE